MVIGLAVGPVSLYRYDRLSSSLRMGIRSFGYDRLLHRLTKIYIIAGKVARQVQPSKIEDPLKDDQMNKTVRELDRELSEWAESLPPSVRHATSDRRNTKMLAVCLTAFFVYYSAIINLRTWAPLFPSGFLLVVDPLLLTHWAVCRSSIHS